MIYWFPLGELWNNNLQWKYYKLHVTFLSVEYCLHNQWLSWNNALGEPKEFHEISAMQQFTMEICMSIASMIFWVERNVLGVKDLHEICAMEL